ncbi:MAG: hypothetical protein F4Z31_16845 [Gemmatimonadetes bacterium]|nr:hypothetical protein [Gemmatimonadota bacterium]MYE92614.1 hypothetical protein [Gemmatimonadota bacterium]
MMSFDTLRAANRLRDEAGFNEVQAAVLVDTFAAGFAERFPTKRDLKGVETALRGDMERMETALRGDMERMETALRGEVKRVETSLEKVETSLRGEIEMLATSVRSDMRDLEHRMTIRLVGLMVLGMGVLLTLQRLLP